MSKDDRFTQCKLVQRFKPGSHTILRSYRAYIPQKFAKLGKRVCMKGTEDIVWTVEEVGNTRNRSELEHRMTKAS